MIAEVEAIDAAKQQVTVFTARGRETLAYDRLVLTLGSKLVRPEIPGLTANSFDLDTYAAAVRLNDQCQRVLDQEFRSGSQ
jgi:NADH:ubiquinone reductase (H+-translocating)